MAHQLSATNHRLRDLEKLIGWRMVSLTECLNFQKLTSLKLFVKAGEGSTSNFVTRAPVTGISIDLDKKNLRGIVFDCIDFQHPVSFRGSVLCGAHFTRCTFNAAINFSDADLRGATFTQSSGMPLPRALLMTGVDVHAITSDSPLVNGDD